MEENTAEGVRYFYFTWETLSLWWYGSKKVTNRKKAKREAEIEQINIIYR
jgi:hypothetical protein